MKHNLKETSKLEWNFVSYMFYLSNHNYDMQMEYVYVIFNSTQTVYTGSATYA